MPLPRLRRGPRPRTADDDDWGTSSPAAIMRPPEHPQQQPHPPEDPPTPPPRHLREALARLKQQDLDSYTCIFTPRSVIVFYFLVSFVFIPLGSAIVAATSRVRTSGSQLYSTSCQTSPTDPNCTVEFTITEKIPAPSYLYYSLTRFHQNHRIYVRSRSDIMNQGILPKAKIDVEYCQPRLYADNSSEAAVNEIFDVNEFIYPCGLTAATRFTDNFQLCKTETCATAEERVATSEKDIAWWTDRDVKFQQGDKPQFQGLPNQLLADEHFMVWMRLSAFPSFDKLYAIVQEELEPATYFMKIENNFDVSEFNGTKAFHISTVQWFGAGNVFLGTIYLVVGVAALFIAIILLVNHIVNPRAPSNDPAVLLRDCLERLEMD